ncbi:uncharacterized protein LOC117341978 [Pecten maximus]|uniref:uncharacterized protein LOC117341978 n=1 Tax=Pecten maximus TaxID=6579 RepID=UPI001458A774|nr:uncharacterized protein LOC117341978 [Pecten maximus]XP_033759779.1 uncharacterized protein LOC117341978 [Pecten maximus]XP_033759780.1 uncharacterized protein LOC117341978 [Pecten maximus]XP_033759781.1 uncharacterized protein LOC117341978 [Pecten maximus]XP_033759782.1 uncharacterized protein LOC117341978 [Pecten maximus]
MVRMRTVNETSTYLTLQSKCLVIVNVLVLLLGVILWRGHTDFRFLSVLLLITGALGAILGTSGWLAKTGDEKQSAYYMVQICTWFFNGDFILCTGIPFIAVTVVACAFSIFSFQSTTLTLKHAPMAYMLLLSSIVLTSLTVVVVSAFFLSVIDHKRSVGASRQQYHTLENEKESAVSVEPVKIKQVLI